MCSMPSTTCPRLCTIRTAVAPDAVLTRRTNEPTPGGYRPHPAGLLGTTRDTDPTTNPLVRAISQHPTPPDPQQRYTSGQAAGPARRGRPRPAAPFDPGTKQQRAGRATTVQQI